MRYFQIYICLILSLAATTTSCQSQPPTVQTPEAQLTTPSPSPTSSETSHPSPQAEVAALPNPLPPDPLDVVFFSEDGIELKGKFYPAVALDQPVLVFMHWYQGDQGDWEEIAYWLQNRGISGASRGVPWLDPSWFPTLPEETSYNVLTFTFRDCEGGCSQVNPEKWLGDARASLEVARSLQGIDPDQVVAIGASIGGDAAISSCAAVVEKDPLACLGALSFSPGNYLGESYPDLVVKLEDNAPPRTAWCLYDEADPDAVVCQGIEGTHYHEEGWQGGNLHGMHLITSVLDPLPLSRLVEFLDLITAD